MLFLQLSKVRLQQFPNGRSASWRTFKQMFTVYVIQNESGKIYIGLTKDLTKRLLRHNHKLPVRKKSFTYKNKGVWKLVYKEMYNTQVEAYKREKQLKSFQGRQFVKRLLMGR